MRAVIEILKPDTIEMKITLSGPLGEWRELKDQLPEKWPSHDLRSALRDAIYQAEKQFVGDSLKPLLDL